jgi:hypothetical protein
MCAPSAVNGIVWDAEPILERVGMLSLWAGPPFFCMALLALREVFRRSGEIMHSCTAVELNVSVVQ